MRAAEIAEGLAGRAADVCAHLFPAGRRNGDEYEVGDLTGAPGRSLRINLNGKAGVWSDFATGDKGDLLDLWREARRLTVAAAMREAAEWLGEPSRRSDRQADDGVPAEAPAGHPKWKGKPTGRWCYTTADGTPWLIVYRYDKGDATKVYFTFDLQAGKWCKGDEHRLPGRRPLYRLGSFAQRPAGEIILAEGEPCADALARLGFAATTTLGGCGQVGHADFSPLKGWRVRIWPDADAAGRQYAETAVAMLRAVGAEPRLVPVPADVPEGWDVADAVRDGWGLEEIRAQLDMAEPCEPDTSSAPNFDGRAEGANGAARFTALDDFAIENQPPLEWAVDRLLPAGGFGVLVGLPGVAKTFLALLLAFFIALGRSFHGRKVQRGKIVYVSAEGQGGLGTRVRVVKRWLEVAGYCGVHFITEPVQLRNPEDVAALLELTAKIPEPVVGFIFDTWPRCIVGSEENSAKESGEAIASVDYIRQRTGAAVFVLHHTDKNGLRERGSSALRGACDMMMIATRDDDLVTVTCEKMKDAEAFDPMHFRLKVIELESGETSCVLEETDSMARRTPPPPGARLSLLGNWRSSRCGGSVLPGQRTRSGSARSAKRNQPSSAACATSPTGDASGSRAATTSPRTPNDVPFGTARTFFERPKERSPTTTPLKGWV